MSHGTRAREIRYKPSGRWGTWSGVATGGVFAIVFLPSGERLEVIGEAEVIVEELGS